MFIINANADIWNENSSYCPVMGDGIVLIFRSVHDAHEYMRSRFKAKRGECSRDCTARGVGTWWGENAWGAPCEARYFVRECKRVGLPAAQPELELDPYDGMTPADHGSDCP